ncbi:hypothetical protein JQ590_08030 [Bradyrhizobium diazoefficiens]|nr:hypothetical protein [Bradyrhizobium diazoefficiens]MBR0768182.1 hypothetical protein [Bradyrhizobium diazoefficiens]
MLSPSMAICDRAIHQMHWNQPMASAQPLVDSEAADITQPDLTQPDLTELSANDFLRNPKITQPKDFFATTLLPPGSP